MKKLGFICMALLAMVAMASCGKEGPMGPEGPVGPEGPAGHDGNAYVASSTLTVVPEDWYWDETSWRVDFNYDGINSDIYNNGFGIFNIKNIFCKDSAHYSKLSKHLRCTIRICSSVDYDNGFFHCRKCNCDCRSVNSGNSS